MRSIACAVVLAAPYVPQGVAPAAPESQAAAATEPKLDSKSRAAIIGKIASLLEENYVFPDRALAAGERLRRAVADGRYEAASGRADLAEALNRDLGDWIGDPHIHLADRTGGPGGPGPRPPLTYGGIRRVAILDGNVGYVEILGFPHLEYFAAAVDVAMERLSSAKALIIDLRENGGGSGQSEAYMASHLFDGATPRKLSGTIHRIAGTRTFTQTLSATAPTSFPFVGRPVAVLVSRQTFSAGEALAYDLKALKRVTLYGEITGGGANPGRPFGIDDSLSITIPNGRTLNPLTGGNWEHVGVAPDRAMPADRALAAALADLGGTAARTATLSPILSLHGPDNSFVRATPRASTLKRLQAFIGELRTGRVNAGAVTRIFMPILRVRLPMIAQQLRDAGPLRKYRFKSIGRYGEERWEADSSAGVVELDIMLTDDGRVAAFEAAIQ